jgi:glutathione S-transferase
MYILYHLPFSADCRSVRIAFAEKKIDIKLEVEPVWERRNSFLAKNPEGTVPVLLVDKEHFICGASVIVEWLDDIKEQPSLVGIDLLEKAEIRRLMSWFFIKFYREVGELIVFEKINKSFMGKGQPNSNLLRVGRKNLKTHIEYVNWLSAHRDWLGGKNFSFADIVAAANFSVLDYLGEISWHDFPYAKEWYGRIKSRPSFRSILLDKVPGMLPAKHYNNLDF